ncbi:sigma-54 interaction domain-containing protein [Isachenkonia alkalipeptolytica]|uniref:sigma-54 interaction domain-containing protein n=1 Tax=Isachenkonia alkalipeptolytica TaxID=2565777 RepID=UPI00352F4E39
MNKWSVSKVFEGTESAGINQNKDIQVDENVINVLDSIFDRIPVSIILIDAYSKILMISQSFADFLGVTKEKATGKTVGEINRNTRFPYVMERKKSEIAWKHTFQNGETAIVHRIPILNRKGESEYGFGMVLFDNIEELKQIIEKNELLTTELKHYKKVLKKIQGAHYSWESIIGESEAIKEAKHFGTKASETESTVLITGESGTGKELFAHAIHNDSKRQDGPFIKVNCGAIPYELLESELFGYVEGAFTGSRKGGQIGKFELAHKGSIFLDEIGDLPMNMQVKLLRVIQEKEIQKLGDSRTVKIDIRIIAATNKNLKEQVKKNLFREDLYYRLNVMSIEVPSLKHRIADIEELSQYLIKKISRHLGKYVTGISKEAMDILKNHNWPGNVRELENVLERAINICDGETIQVKHFPIYLLEEERPAENNVRTDNRKIPDLKKSVENMEKNIIKEALYLTMGNKVRAAQELGISRSSLYDKIKEFGL